MGGDVKQYGVLYADVEGFSEFGTSEVRDLITTHFAQVHQLVVKQVADLNVYVNTWGDGIVVVSGNPLNLAQFALAVRDHFANYDRPMNEEPIRLRMALHFGKLEECDSPLAGRSEFIGAALITATRLQVVVPPSEVWATQEFIIAMRRDKRPVPLAEQQLGTIELPKQGGSVCVHRLRIDGIDAEWSGERLEEARHHVVASRHLNDLARRSIRTLRDPVVDTREDDYVLRFRHAVQQLERGDHVWCLCGDKDWMSPSVLDYMNDFIMAAVIRGVNVRRAYFEPANGEFSGAEKAVIAVHHAWSQHAGVPLEVRVVRLEDAKVIRDQFSLPVGFGLVLPYRARPTPTNEPERSSVMFHYGFQKGRAKAKSFSDPGLLAFYQAIFESAWSKGKRIDAGFPIVRLANPDPEVLRGLTSPREFLLNAQRR